MVTMFPFEEALVIEALLKNEGLDARKQAISLGASRHGGGRHTYILGVADEHFETAIDLLMAHFHLGEPSPFSGACTACGQFVDGALSCPECGINLSDDAAAAMKTHPFVLFLKESGRL